MIFVVLSAALAISGCTSPTPSPTPTATPTPTSAAGPTVLSIMGMVNTPKNLSLSDLNGYPQHSAGWQNNAGNSSFNGTGPYVLDLLNAAGLKGDAKNITFTCVAVIFTDTALMAAAFGLLAALAVLTGAFRHWYGTLWKALPFVAVVVLASTLFPRISYGPVLFAADLWIFHPSVTPGGFVYSLGVGLRLLTVAGVSTLFIMTTRFEDFVAGLRKLHMPYVVAFSLGLALRSITLMSADLKTIMDAQRSRCLELDAGGLLSRNRLMSLIMPMTICLINRSRNVSSAMHCRGYSHTDRPTLFSRLRLGAYDWTIIACLFAGVTALAYLNWIKL